MTTTTERIAELPPDMASWDAEAYAAGVRGYDSGVPLTFLAERSNKPSEAWARRSFMDGWLDAQRVARQRGGVGIPPAVARALDDGDIPFVGV